VGKSSNGRGVATSTAYSSIVQLRNRIIHSNASLEYLHAHMLMHTTLHDHNKRIRIRTCSGSRRGYGLACAAGHIRQPVYNMIATAVTRLLVCSALGLLNINQVVVSSCSSSIVVVLVLDETRTTRTSKTRTTAA
jgi:hypothetical protein